MRSLVYLTWKNYLGGFDYFPFVAYHDQGVDIEDSGQAEVNIFPDWPNSYGEFADTVTKQTFRTSKSIIVVRSQYVSATKLDTLKWIRLSPLVQMLTTRYDRRTVIVDDNSFTIRKGQDKIYSISFTIKYTDYLPSQ